MQVFGSSGRGAAVDGIRGFDAVRFAETKGYGQLSCADPKTCGVVGVICDSGKFGSTGAVAKTPNEPVTPHEALPVSSTLPQLRGS